LPANKTGGKHTLIYLKEIVVTRGKILVLLAMTACATALSVAPASAFFKASSGKYPVTIVVSKNEVQKFKIGANLKTECTTVTGTGTLVGEGSQLTAAPVYSGCKGELATIKLGEVKVKTNGCLYNFHQALGATKGTVSIECPSGKSIEFEAVLGCLIKVGKANNANLGPINLANEGSGTTEEVKLEPLVTGIHYFAKGCSEFVTEEPTEGTNAEYEGVVLVKGLVNNGGVLTQTGILLV
jgi:hypothetical protein